MSEQAITILASDGRASWDEYGLALAATASTRATCSRSRNGAVILKNRIPVVAGYSGAPAGMAHCDDVGCSSADGAEGGYERCVALHAAANAVIHSGPEQRQGATLYCTSAPCFECAKLIAGSGVAEVVAGGGCYEEWERSRKLLLDAGVRVRVLRVKRRAAAQAS